MRWLTTSCNELYNGIYIILKKTKQQGHTFLMEMEPEGSLEFKTTPGTRAMGINGYLF